MNVVEYFGVKDVREIRNSPRFKEEVESNFVGDIILSQRGGDLLDVVGRHKQGRGDGSPDVTPGVYSFACDGAHAGCFVRAAMTF
jgi:hypothetical protein